MLIHLWPKPEPISKVIIHSSRQYGQPRLKKPTELKGVKQAFSVEWIYKKCRCQCFVLNNDIYIKHRDFNSISLYGLTVERRKRFVYNDNFSCVVLRGEAWIILKDVIVDIKNNVFPAKIFQGLAKQITGEIGCGDWERFFDQVVREYGKWTNNIM